MANERPWETPSDRNVVKINRDDYAQIQNYTGAEAWAGLGGMLNFLDMRRALNGQLRHIRRGFSERYEDMPVNVYARLGLQRTSSDGRSQYYHLLRSVSDNETAFAKATEGLKSDIESSIAAGAIASAISEKPSMNLNDYEKVREIYLQKALPGYRELYPAKNEQELVKLANDGFRTAEYVFRSMVKADGIIPSSEIWSADDLLKRRKDLIDDYRRNNPGAAKKSDIQVAEIIIGSMRTKADSEVVTYARRYGISRMENRKNFTLALEDLRNSKGGIDPIKPVTLKMSDSYSSVQPPMPPLPDGGLFWAPLQQIR